MVFQRASSSAASLFRIAGVTWKAWLSLFRFRQGHYKALSDCASMPDWGGAVSSDSG